METGSDRPSFIAGLLKKQADTKRLADESGANFSAADEEVNRQMREISSKEKGNIVTGEGVSKSGGDD